MLFRPTRSFGFRIASIALLLSLAVVLVSAPGGVFTKKNKAFYADENLLNFVRPGLVLKVLSASIADDGTIKTRVRIEDPMGIPLDRLGVETPGPVSLSFIAAVLPANSDYYKAYTTRSATSPITGVTAIQASSDSGGKYSQVAPGEYEYTFGTKAPSGFDKTATHTIGVYSTRNLTEFDLGSNRIDAVYNFVPAGGNVVKVRDMIATKTCNKCHDLLGLHGGSRQQVALCNLCHNPGVIDPDTGNTVDMKVMIHKIHMGHLLPSVEAGKPYQIIGNRQSVHDYSHVAMPSDIRACQHCHEAGPTQANNWLTKPGREVCGSCHDNINFDTGAGHLGLPQPTDNFCKNCHYPEGDYEFDTSIKGAHTIPEFSRELSGVVFTIDTVADTAPGQKPLVTFSVKNKKGEPYDVPKLSRLALVLAGNTKDYTEYYSEDPRAAAEKVGDGVYRYRFTKDLPQSASGTTWTVGIEGYNNFTLNAGTQKQMTVRDAGKNVQKSFVVGSGTLAPRRQSVDLAKCNNCHRYLSLHGGNRNVIGQCVLCHNPKNTDQARRPANQMPAESIQLAHMVHRIHLGEENGGDYIVYGFGNTPHNYGEVRYPAPRNSCDMCHVDGGFTLPRPAGLQPVTTPRDLINPMQPVAAACLGCHISIDAASHALVNTSTLGESCTACHGEGKTASVSRVHAQ